MKQERIRDLTLIIKLLQTKITIIIKTTNKVQAETIRTIKDQMKTVPQADRARRKAKDSKAELQAETIRTIKDQLKTVP